MAEYVLLTSLIAIVCIVAFAAIGSSIALLITTVVI